MLTGGFYVGFCARSAIEEASRIPQVIGIEIKVGTEIVSVVATYDVLIPFSSQNLVRQISAHVDDAVWRELNMDEVE
jgi:hypothetical protein